MSSKDCLIVSGLYCLARGIQSNDLPPTHRETHSFHPGPYFTSLQCECTVCVSVSVWVLLCKHTFMCINVSVYICALSEGDIGCLQSVRSMTALFSVYIFTTSCFHSPSSLPAICTQTSSVHVLSPSRLLEKQLEQPSSFHSFFYVEC